MIIDVFNLKLIILKSLLAFTGILLIYASIYYIIKRKEKLSYIKRQMDFINSIPVNKAFTSGQKAVVIDVVNHCSVYHLTFVIHGTIGVLFELFSLSYSIVALILSLIGDTDSINVMISLAAIIFVIVTVYIQPATHARQYLWAWRRVNKCILELMSVLSDELSGDQGDIIAKAVERLGFEYSESENSLSTDEN